MNALIFKDLTSVAVTLPLMVPPAPEALIGTAPSYRSDFRDDLTEGLCVAPFATNVTDASSIALAPELSAAGTRCDFLARAHRDLREPLTALLRLNSDWDFPRTNAVAQRMIEQQRQTLEVMTDLIEGLLIISESETAGQPTVLTALASRSAGERPRPMEAPHASPAETWSAARSMNLALKLPESPAVDGLASQAHRVLLIDEDQGALCALRIYLLCAGYRVFAAASADEALDLARMVPSLIDIVIADSDLTRHGDGIAAIAKTRRLAGYSMPAVLLMDRASIEISKPGLDADVSPLRKPIDVEELNALIGELLRGPRAHSLGLTEKRRAAVGIA
jgi:CheY-like chemotaxis protein